MTLKQYYETVKMHYAPSVCTCTFLTNLSSNEEIS